MNLVFLFQRGVTPKVAADAAGVHISTACRWRDGEAEARWEHITKLYARGLLTDDDLRAAGLGIPRVTVLVQGGGCEDATSATDDATPEVPA